jgi:putative flippase GtrA
VIRQFVSKQFLAFLVTGGIAAVVNFSSRILYNHWMSFSLAIVFAYLTGMVTAFILAKLFVFSESQRPIHHSIFFFTAVNLVAVLQTWLISMGLAYYALPTLGVQSYSQELSHAIGIVVPVFTSYLGHKHWSFSDRESQAI